MYLIDSSSPFDPGARPSNSSDERILMCASNASGVMTSSAGLSFSSGLSAAKRKRPSAKTRTKERRNVFITEIFRDSSTSLGMTRLWWQASRLQSEPDGRLTLQPRTAASTEERRNYLLSFDGPTGAFFLSSPFTPIFFRNGSTDFHG